MAELTALERAKAVIAKRASDPRAKAFGFADDLRVIGGAIDELEYRAGLNAEAYLLLYEATRERLGGQSSKVTLAPALVGAMGAMSVRAKQVALRLLHTSACMCSECMTARAREQMPVTR